MLLQPKKTKYRKSFKGKISGYERKVINIKLGKFGIKAMKSARISAQQLEALRKSLNKLLKNRGKIWLKIFPNIPATSKPIEVRMGKGKGQIDHWFARINAGRILFELQGLPFSLNKQVLKLSKDKLSIPVKMIYN